MCVGSFLANLLPPFSLQSCDYHKAPLPAALTARLVAHVLARTRSFQGLGSEEPAEVPQER